MACLPTFDLIVYFKKHKCSQVIISWNKNNALDNVLSLVYKVPKSIWFCVMIYNNKWIFKVPCHFGWIIVDYRMDQIKIASVCLMSILLVLHNAVYISRLKGNVWCPINAHIAETIDIPLTHPSYFSSKNLTSVYSLQEVTRPRHSLNLLHPRGLRWMGKQSGAIIS